LSENWDIEEFLLKEELGKRESAPSEHKDCQDVRRRNMIADQQILSFGFEIGVTDDTPLNLMKSCIDPVVEINPASSQSKKGLFHSSVKGSLFQRELDRYQR
jgi:hypothetical protein